MIKTRFAPSPTGNLHIGGLRTAIFNYFYAKANNGKFILRIEDTDKERSKDEYIQSILEALKWCDISWDEIYYQSKRNNIYKKHIDQLIKENKAYKCYCSKERLENLKKMQRERGENPHYDGFCRNLIRNIENKPYVVRVKLPEENIDFYDHVHGKIHFSYKEFDDFIIQRSDGSYMYNFANTIDDIEINITHVIRGDDHITNTAKQIVIYKLLDKNVPEYIHIPMIMGKDKSRLSKRHGAKNVLEYRNDGYLSWTIVNYLVRLGWSYGDQEIFSKKDLLRYFDLDHLNKSSTIFNPNKLKWMNEYYLRHTDIDKLVDMSLDFLNNDCKSKEKEFLKKAFMTVITRVSTLVDLSNAIEFYCIKPKVYEKKAIEKYITKNIKTPLLYLLSRLQEINFNSINDIKMVFENVVSHFNIKMVSIAQPIRIAITGKAIGPGIYESLYVLGKEESLQRINKLFNEYFL